MQRRDDIDLAAADVLSYLEQHSYDDTAAHFHTSRGKIYSLAVAHQRRKYEALIHERRDDRKRRQREFLQEALDSVQTCDVLDFLAGIPDDSVGLHLTSPPYNVGKHYGDSEDVDARSFYFFLGWLLQVLAEMVRTLKPNGVMFLQLGSTRDIMGRFYPLDCLLFEHLKGMGLTFQSRICWVFSHGLTPRSRLSERFETALVMSKGDSCTFNANAARFPHKDPAKRAFKGPNKGKLSGHPLGSWPSNVWTIPGCGHNHPDTKYGRHPAQFPLQLAKRAILLYTLPQDLVSDVFVGSGTSFIAAKQTHRAFVGADLFYQDLRAKRLANVSPDLYVPFTGVTEESLAVWQAEAVPVEYKPSRPITTEQNKQLILALNNEDIPEAA